MNTFFRRILAGWILSIALPFLTPGVLAQTQPYAWGWNSFGQVGNNSPAQQNLPAAVSASGVLAGKTVVALSAGENHTLALCSDGSLASWGWNWYGQLGIGNNAQSLVPVTVNASAFPSPNSVTAIAAGQLHSLALCSNGALFAWGHNVTGVLGNGSLAGSLVPVGVNQSGVLSGKVVKAIAAGYNHCLVLCADGTLAAWGNNFSGQLGNNSTTPSSLPILVEASGVLAGRTVIAIAAGHGHSLVLCSDGSMVSWGQNSSGQLGNNSFTDSLVPVLVNMNVAPGVFLGRTVVAISAGDYHSLGLCDDGAAIAWGLNSSGQVGENTSNPWRSVPGLVNTTIGVSALAGKTVTAIAAGSGHNLVVCSDGTVAAWGRNSEGQIGDNSTTQRPAPVSVDISALPPGTSFNRVFSGSSAYHSLALPVAAPCPPQILVRGSSVTILNGDTTPTGGDSTAFFDAAVCGNASVTHQFTVFNFGNCPLTVTNIVSSNPAEFSVSAGTFPIVIPGGGSWSDFSVTFNPSAVGDRSATISLINDDPTTNPYTFAVNGNGIASQIGVLGNNPSAAILNGDLTPTLTDDTAFGSLQVNSTGTPHVFTITNIGTATLLLNGAPPVAISGPNAGEFTVNQPTVTSVLPGGTATFSVVFHPGVIGLCTATLSITNSDCTATPYEFAIQGEGVAPPPLELACAGSKIVKCDQVWTFDPPVATNACGAAGVTLTVVNTTTNGSCPKTVIRTWLATDACGNTATCSQTVTVVDTTPPVLTCATHKTVQCGTAWTFDAPTASDACSTNVTISIFHTVTNGICPLVITRAWLATDPCGNTSTCSQTVTVAPALPPNSPAVISGPIYNPANGHYYYLLAENTWTASEVEAVAMGGHLATVRNQAENDWIYTQFSQFGGVSRGLWIGLNDAAEEGAFVWASGEPVSYFNWGSNEPVNQNGLDDYVHLFWPGDARAPQWNDQWDVIVMGSGSAGVSINGVVEVSNPPPLLACAPNKTVACGTSWDFDAPNASDSCSGANVTVTVVNTVTNSLNPLVITRTWQAVNACNNTNTCSQTVTVVDTTPPVLTCATNKTVQCGTAWTFDAPTVSDSCSGTNLTVSILSTVTNGVCPRVITRTWQATDAYGNTNTCSQVVSVVDTTPPVLTCATNKTVQCGTAWTFDAPTVSDSCSGTNLIVSILSTVTNGVCPRIITRTWVATDACGNTNTCSQSVTVVDTMPPTIACPGKITRYTCANAIRVYYAAWAGDACSPTVSLSYSPPSGSYFAAGTTTPVTVTATDGCGNTSTCTFQVKVINQNASQILVRGLPDWCNLSVADPAAVRSACLNSSYSPAHWNSFDNSTINRRVGVSWQGLPSSITSAQVITRMKPRKTPFNTPQNDTIAFGLGTCNPASWLWSQSIGTVLGQPWLFQPNCGVTFAFNLQALPPGGGTTSLLPHLNSSSHRLDMLVQNDTVVDYAWMRIRYCAPIIFNGSSVTLGNAIAIATPSGWLLAQDPEVVGATNASAAFALGDTLHARLSLDLAALTQSPQGRLNVSFSATDSEEVVEDFGFQLVSTPRADGPATTWQPVAPSGSSNPRVRLMNADREVGASSGMKPIQVRGEIPAAEIIFNGGTNVIARFATTVSVGGGAGGPPLLVDAIQFSFDLSAAPDVASTVIVLNLSELPEVGIRGLASGSARGFDAIQGNVLAQSSGDMIVLSPQDEDSNDPFGVSLSVAPAHEFRAVLGASFDVFAPTSPGSSLALFTRGLVGGQDRELPGLRFDYTQPGWTLAATRDGTPLPLRRAQVWNRGAIVADLMSPTSVQWASLPQLHWPSLVGTTDAEIVHRFPSSTAVDVVVDGMTYSGTEVRITTGTFGEPVEALTGLRVEAVRAELLAMSPLDVGAVSYRLEVPESGDDEVTVRWSGVGGVLESASSLDGAWSAVAGSEGGEVTLPVETTTARFFRVRGQ